MTKQQPTFRRYVSGLILALCSTSALAAEHTIEPSHIWVNSLEVRAGSIAAADSDHSAKVQRSLVQSWLNQEVSGTRLSEWQPDSASASYILHVPVGVERFTQGHIEVEGAEHSAVFLNGELISKNSNGYELIMQTGDHQLLVLVEQVESPDALNISWQGKADHDVIHTERPDSYRLHATQLYDAQTTTGLNLSPDGNYLLWHRQHYTEVTGDTAQHQVQLVDVSSREVVYEWSGTPPSSLAWHPSSQRLAYIAQGRIQVLDVERRQVRALTEELGSISSLRWLSDEQLVFSWMRANNDDASLTKHYRALQDRWSYFRNNSQLFIVATDSGAISQLTQDDISLSLQDVRADGEYVIATQSLIDYATPPHALTRLLEIEVDSGEQRTIGEYRTLNQVRYAEEGLYVVAGPEFADGIGRTIDDELLANNYDGQLYWMNSAGEDVRPLSRDFAPAIGRIERVAGDDLIVSSTDRDRTALYQYQASSGRFSVLDRSVDVVDTFSVSQHSNQRVAFAGTSATAPQRLYVQELGQSPQLWWDSARDYYPLNRFTPVREWNFNNQRGDTIYGRIYLPHDFDESRQYPALVYYYGGTTPVQRAFTGRYPFPLWADMGYVVYVIQPSGAIGFGQEFSARHVNAWGEYTTDDIIEGTRRFIADHDFVDGDRVGNMGASYGGFMTMLLAAKTDIFAASMSHAGISHITSYWGQGWWGFLYSGEASKGSFPWDSPELYRERSPVNLAQQINTPLLLIHGDADTNVPPGESHTMYTALKLLDKEVELVEYIGEDHNINRRTPRLHWWQTYMAFFDKHLKDEPQWWEYLYPED